MARIGTRKLLIEIDGTEYSAEVSSARVTSAEAESDFTTFADAAAGGARDYALSFTAVQDAATGTLWSTVFDNAGATVPVTFIPYGNEEPSVAQPHFAMNAVVSEPDGDFIGGEANPSARAWFTFEAEWPLDGKPVRVTV